MSFRVTLSLCFALLAVAGCRPGHGSSREDHFRSFATQFMQEKVVESEPLQSSGGEWYRVQRIVRNCQFEFYPPSESINHERALIRYEFKPLYTANHPAAQEAAADHDFGPAATLSYDVGWRWQTAMFHWVDGHWQELE